MADTNTPQKSGPDSHSADYEASAPFWSKVTDVLSGVEAMRVMQYGGQLGGPPIQYQNVPDQQFNQGRGIELESPYLPRFPNEPYADYDRRRRNAFLTNVYSDIVKSLVSKPFSKTCELVEGSSEELVNLSENIDGLSNNLHVFASDTYDDALNRGISWIFVDHTNIPLGTDAASERAMGARPYWIHVHAEDLIAVYSKFLRGQEVIYHARIRESVSELDGYDENKKERVREFNRKLHLDTNNQVIGFGPATWKLLEETKIEGSDRSSSTTKWIEIENGAISIGVIPLIPVIIGKRQGVSWKINPPLRDLVYMQIKLFQMESNLDAIKDLTAFPMLSGDGIDLNSGTGSTTAQIKVPVGPRAVLAAPPGGDGSHGSWKYLEPAGSSLNFLQADIEKYVNSMHELGMQPMTTSNLTVVTTANVSVKVHSVGQAWALALKDALEQAWKITAQWLGLTVAEPEVALYVPPPIRVGSETNKDWLLKAEAQGIISPQTTREQAQSLGVLNDDYDEKKEPERLASHQEGQVLQPEKRIDPITGKPVVVQPKFGELNPPPPPPPPKPPRPTVN